MLMASILKLFSGLLEKALAYFAVYEAGKRDAHQKAEIQEGTDYRETRKDIDLGHPHDGNADAARERLRSRAARRKP